MAVVRYPIIIGPTAGGKTDLALGVACSLREQCSITAEIVSADAIQIYRGLDIGSAKPTIDERRGVPHHLIDIVDPTEPFTVHDWLNAANAAIVDIQSRGGIPIVVGGTHLYIKALIDGMFHGPGADESIRAELAALPRETLRAELERIDPAAAARLHPNDIRRTIRAIEVFRLTGKPISEHQKQWDRAERADDDGSESWGTQSRSIQSQLVVLDWPTELINRRINARVKGMISRGLLEETRALWSAHRFGTQSREALGYKQLIAHLEGRCTLDEAIEQIKIETRRFAKNQRTWLRRLRSAGGISIDAASAAADEQVRLVLHACCG